MARWTGFGRLKTPGDLLAKMRHDLERMRADPADEYAAIDFFSAAEHLVDWQWPNDPEKRRAERSTDLPATVSHLASGAKYLSASGPSGSPAPRRSGAG